MALSIKCEGSFSADGESMYFADSTGNYNAITSPTGWGAPNPTSGSVTSFQVKCNWVSVGAIITYNFTVASNVITAATVTDNEGTTVNILSSISTVFPSVSPYLIDLTNDFSDAIVLPTLADGQFILTYKVIGTYNTDYSYTTSTTYFRQTALCCCLKELRLTADPSCDCNDVQAQVNRVEYWLTNAWCAIDAGKPNETALEYFTKAQEECDSDCAGCN